MDQSGSSDHPLDTDLAAAIDHNVRIRMPGSHVVFLGMVLLIVLVVFARLASPGSPYQLPGAPAHLASPESPSPSVVVDQRTYDCGLSTPGNEVTATIELAHAKDFWSAFPAALDAPELHNDLPALVVIFRGDYTWFRTGDVYQNVVCVNQDGYPHIYPNVDLRGARLQP